MKTMSIQDAQTNLATLIQEVERGEEIVISSDGRPVARLVALTGIQLVHPARPRTFGYAKGRIGWDDRFFDPLPEEELALWEGGADENPA